MDMVGPLIPTSFDGRARSQIPTLICIFIWLFKIEKNSRLLPFCLVLCQMIIFSFAAEKGVRYLCVVLPFMAAAAAVALEYIWVNFQKYSSWIVGVASIALVVMVYLSAQISFAKTDYEAAVDYINALDPQAIIVTTQPLIEALYIDDDKRILPCPKDMMSLMMMNWCIQNWMTAIMYLKGKHI